jgi:phosphate transport system protein
MSKHLQRDLDELRKHLLEVGAMVEEATNRAMTALTHRRKDLAAEVLAADDEIDYREVQIEEACLKILALHQPVAADLRFVIAAMKVNNDLERMGDQAVNIAERAIYLAERPPLDVPLNIERMAEVARSMVRVCLDAVVRLDVEAARSVGTMDDEVDEIHRAMFRLVQDRIRKSTDAVEQAIAYLSASRDLERIADLATNIAEDVIFTVEGEVVRHRWSTGAAGDR